MPGAVLEHCLRRLEHAGVRTLYAHAERSRAFADDDGLARDLVARGGRLQINAGSLCPGAGARGKFAWKLVDEGLVSVVASDAHALGLRPPRLADAADAIARRLGEDAVHTLMQANPAALCDGRDAPPFQPTDESATWRMASANGAQMSTQTPYRESPAASGQQLATMRGGEPPEQSNEFQAFASMLRRRKWIVVAVTLFGALNAFAYASLQKNVYQASVLMRVQTSSSAGSSFNDTITASIALAKTYVVELTNGGFVQQAARSLKTTP